MFTLTVKIAEAGTTYIDQDTHEVGSSFAGHMWFSLSDGITSYSYGFAPIEHGNSFGPGEITTDDDQAYQSTYYSGAITITPAQYFSLKTWAPDPADFSQYYVAGAHDCINYTWDALRIAGYNPGNSDGSAIPSWNADEVDKTLYTALLGSATGWDESLPDGGNYNAVYGSTGNDTLTITNLSTTNNSIFGGGGDDIISLNTKAFFYLEKELLQIDGGESEDTIQGTAQEDNLDLSNAELKDVEQIDMGGGDDTVKVSTSQDGPGMYTGGTGNDTIDGTMAGRGLELNGGVGNDTLIGGAGDDTLRGGDDNEADTLKGGAGHDLYYARNNDIIEDSDGRGMVYFGSWFDGTILSYGYKKKGSDVYEGNGGEYRLSGGTLTFTSGGRTVTIRGYSKDEADLGIRLEEEPPDDPQAPQDFSSPLVLDLNNNQQTSTSLYETDVHFDIDGDGFMERVGWIESGDGLLTLDSNQNGTIDNGSELFGNHTPDTNGNYADDGFQALGRYDDNLDGVINADDEIFSSLTIWTDDNSDGISQAGELHSLAGFNITSISLDSDESDSFEVHNQTKGDSTFTRTYTDGDGNEQSEDLLIRDVWFLRDNADTTYTFEGTVSPDISALPDMKGTGRMMNLSHAMSGDTELQSRVEALLANGSASLSSLYSNADELLARWTPGQNIVNSAEMEVVI